MSLASTWFVSLLAISAAVWQHGHGSSTADRRNPFFVEIESPDGPLEVFGRRTPDDAVKVTFFGKESPVFSVVLATDGRTALVKSEYNRRGELIECDLIEHPADVRRFVSYVDENIRKATADRQSPTGAAAARTYTPALGSRDVFDLNAQIDACQRLLAKRAQPDNDEESTSGSHGKRSKRSYLIWPGTNWCGKGSKAEFAESFGPNKETDQCCQKHDQCPYMIEGFSTRYNLFNYRIHTLSHCDCDVQFMDCLKSANTSTSSMVGKVYFNVVNTECFELNLQKSCARRSWWGGCEKYTTKWTAGVKSLGNFPEQS